MKIIEEILGEPTGLVAFFERDDDRKLQYMAVRFIYVTVRNIVESGADDQLEVNMMKC